MKSLLSGSFRPCLFYEILFIQIFSCQHLICLKVFLNRLIYNFLWKCPVVVWICFQPVTGKLFVKRWLSMSGFITISRPETGTVRSEHLISNYHISIFIKSELKFCICNNDTFAQSIFGTFLIESNCVVAKFLSEFTSSSRIIFFKVINALLE